ncbi:MAG: sodium:solute symporter [Thermoguttaceae bacterium]|nr:sodium:solute symporter [Thermoguttaceae bacterium]MDI9444101.1 sodium:solute symporter [Planctomycetota bacterium]
MNSHFTQLDWAVLAAYFAATMSIGFYFWRKSRSTEGFTAAGRALPGWVCGLSIFATYLSSISYLALPGKSFADNWNPFVFSLSIPIATWIAVRWFLPYYRASGEVSAYALLERRFGVWARLYASVFYLLTQIARMGVVMYLMALPMAVIFGWDIRLVILFTGVSVTIYSFVGGIIAVIWADAIQALVLMAGAVICLAVLLLGVEGGPFQVFSTAAAAGKFSLGQFGAGVDQGRLWLDAGSATFLVVLLYGLFINLQNFGIDQSYIQRYIASSSDREARKSLWLGGILYVPVSAVFFLIGTALFVYYNSEQHERDLPEVRQLVARQRLMQQGVYPEYEDAEATVPTPDYRQSLDGEAAGLTDTEIGDRVFPHFIAKHLPPGLTGLLIAAVFAAAMSTVSTSLNSSATLLMTDYYRRFLNPRATEKQCMLALYASTIAWGILGTGMALVLVKLTDSALDIWWTLSGIFGGGMCGLFLLGIVSRRANSPAAAAGVVTGVLVILWMSFPKLVDYLLSQPPGSRAGQVGAWFQRLGTGWLSPFHAFMVPVVGTMAILLVGLLVARLSGARGGRPAGDSSDA